MNHFGFVCESFLIPRIWVSIRIQILCESWIQFFFFHKFCIQYGKLLEKKFLYCVNICKGYFKSTNSSCTEYLILHIPEKWCGFEVGYEEDSYSHLWLESFFGGFRPSLRIHISQFYKLLLNSLSENKGDWEIELSYRSNPVFEKLEQMIRN